MDFRVVSIARGVALCALVVIVAASIANGLDAAKVRGAQARRWPVREVTARLWSATAEH